MFEFVIDSGKVAASVSAMAAVAFLPVKTYLDVQLLREEQVKMREEHRKDMDEVRKEQVKMREEHRKDMDEVRKEQVLLRQDVMCELRGIKAALNIIEQNQHVNKK